MRVVGNVRAVANMPQTGRAKCGGDTGHGELADMDRDAQPSGCGMLGRAVGGPPQI
jgi:hypothetical protein